ncbi:metalloendopeptidase [Paenibacillus faecis]|uniref:Peptidoglycan DD-metalloendopeptidase family protein n=1 Tax=Paenibacillus faecis TaxID=862114 RepID=A0A5D0CQ07_9BACL|nr:MULTISPECIES: M23 family metallopeptidase [Paenibacillus]MCA1293942.1 peptidoglycan DD-metalloendopeptidase family protein [Paenibacillus sp. alder61]TYA11828.1 peptidoglycan DD-metalloendopeptidase family protein [Paenibacillus faecis]GIO88754.1 metalloendopeptidase [Paenibacillus faecis]
MKRWISIVAVIALAAVIFQPTEGFAKSKTINQIDKELKQLQEQARQAKKQQEQAEAQKQSAQHYVNKNKEYLNIVMQQITTVSNELAHISMDIENTEQQLRDTAVKLEETKARIAERSDLLDSRIRLMYTDGAVSYLDVLLSSTSFTDFLERADSLQAIANQDHVLLEEHKQDKDLLVEQQEKLNNEYDKVKKLYADAESRRSTLEKKEEEKQQLIAKYYAEIEESDDISEEQEKLLVELATKRASLEKEKNKLKAAQIYTYKRKKSSSSSASSGSSSGGFHGNGGSMGLPVNGARLSSGYGSRIHPITGKRKTHTGVDLAAPQGTDIHAAEGGVVIVAEWWSGYGNTVIIDHGDNVWTLYGHIRNGGIKVEKGQQVKRGEKIAEVGSTGNSTGPHCHFEVRINGNPVDPMPYL